MDQWQSFRVELHKEAEAIFNSSGEVVLVESSAIDSELALISRTKHLKITYIPERNMVKWETAKEYGFEPIPESTASLAASLMRRVHHR